MYSCSHPQSEMAALAQEMATNGSHLNGTEQTRRSSNTLSAGSSLPFATSASKHCCTCTHCVFKWRVSIAVCCTCTYSVLSDGGKGGRDTLYMYGTSIKHVFIVIYLLLLSLLFIYLFIIIIIIDGGSHLMGFSLPDCRAIVKTLVCGMKTITWGAGSCRLPGSAVDYGKEEE